MSFPIVLAISFLACVPLAWSWYRAAHPKVAPPETPKPPEPLLDLPLSCFVEGLITSLETEPEKWDYEEQWVPYSHARHSYIKAGVELVFSCYDGGTIVGIRDPFTALNRTEEAALARTLFKVNADREAAKTVVADIEAAKLRAPFEAFGCPKSP